MKFSHFFRKLKSTLTGQQLRWNKMWELWAEGNAESPYAELMTYQSEINNGGHDQYFTNVENTGDLQQELSALAQVLPAKLNRNLQEAYQAYLRLEANNEDEAAEELLEQCDEVFYESECEINRILEDYAELMEV